MVARIGRVGFLAAFLIASGIGAPSARAVVSSQVMVGWSVSGSNTPKYATWDGSAWSSASSMVSVGGNPNWVVLRMCPTRNEVACGTSDGYSDVNVMFYNGSSWSSATEVSAEADETDDRNFDIAYEQNSGDALIVYYDLTENNFGYRTYNGSTLSSESDLSRTYLEGNDYITLISKPESDNIVLITLGQHNGSGQVISANVWTGSSWAGWTTIESAAVSNDDECYGLAFETSSGDGLLVYGETGQTTPRYRTLSGTTWSSESSLPSTGDAPKWIRLASDPTSNQILFAGLDNSNDLNVNAWNGSSWGSNVEVETLMAATDRRGFDIAYEAGENDALLVYIESSTHLHYRTWNGSSWGSEQDGTDLLNQGRTVQLRTGVETGEVFIAATDDGGDVELMRWTGSSMTAKTKIEDNVGGTSLTESFMVAVPPASSLEPANVPYTQDFSGSVGAEWSVTTTTSNSTLTKYLGRFTTSTAKLALNTTVGETYSISLDLYCFDSWDGSHADYGPDGFNISIDGTEIFNETFVHEWPSYGASYPYPYDQMGSYAHGSDQDAAYRKVQAVFTAGNSVTMIDFNGYLSEDIDNESWGIDNVAVKFATFKNVSTTRGFNSNTTSGVTKGSGLHWGDLDNDGDLDAVVTGGASARKFSNQGSSGSYAFTTSTLGTGVVREQGALLDIDNDGDLDFWSDEVTGDGIQRIFINDGAGNLTDSGDKGFTGPGTNEGMAAADVDGDGDCDLVVFSENGNWIGHNSGGSTITVTGTNSSTYGMNTSGDYGARGYCAAGDANNDGRLDFFYNYSSGKLFISDGDGTYTRNNYSISISTGEIGSAWGDYDNDGDLDLFVPRVEECRTGYLWRNDRDWTAGTGSFTNVTSSAGLSLNSGTDYTPDHVGARSGCWGDYDNDGDLDLFIVGGDGNPLLYQNQGSGTFSRVAEGITYSGTGIDAVFVDYDNDGDLDLALTRDNATTMLFENRTNNSNYLKVRVLGRGDGGTNKAAIGTRVELWNSAGTTRLARRDFGVARGFGGAEPLMVHFGGTTPTTTYQVRTYFASRLVSDPYITAGVVPNSTSSTVGSATLAKTLTVEEPSKVKVINWYEVRNKP